MRFLNDWISINGIMRNFMLMTTSGSILIFDSTPISTTSKVVTRAVLFKKSSRSIDKKEKSLIRTYRKLLIGATNLRCIGYTYSKQPSKSERKLAKDSAIAACKYLVGSKKFTFKTSIRAIKGAPLVKRSLKSKSQRVDLQITRKN